jgi:hypothetical protein
MRKSRFNDSQRQAIIDSYLSGKKTVEAICEENLRLKKMYAELQLKHEVVSEAVSYLKKVQAQKKRRD